MIGVDTNILIYAHRFDSPFNQVAFERLTELANGAAAWGIPWPCLHEFLAIVTHPRIFSPPTSLERALSQIDIWLESPSLALLTESPTHWSTLRALLVESSVIGPRVHDARIMALCRQHGVRELWSADRDFSRFAGVTVVNPLVGQRGFHEQ
ncbi:MAG TPA: TA system VapC family ribonuclease toxin [Xanthobacteraceae bacterium]|nr:TA system VapC family ribonuclease toxin [Xanthobacteraceae bacterium]